MKIVKISHEVRAVLETIAWPLGCPVPAVDLAIDWGKTMFRFVAVELAPAETAAAQCFSSIGTAPIEVIQSLALLCEAWVRAHGCDPGAWPTGVRAQLCTRVDMRTAAAWLYSSQIAVALAESPPRL